MSTLKLALSDFVAALPFSNKIEDRQVQPFVQLDYSLTLVPLLGYAVLEEVDALPAAEITPYVAGADVAADALVSRRERVYRALTTNPLTEPIDGLTTTAWRYEPLYTLWTQYLKPFWLHHSFGRFLAQHGLDITKAGITVPIDRAQGTYDRASAADKGALLASVAVTAEAWRSKLTAFLRNETQAYGRSSATGYNYGNTHEGCHASSAPRTRLRGINKRR